MSDTPETNALIATDQRHLEDDNFMPVSTYWRMCDLARKLERERDNYREQADGYLVRLGETQERMIDAERERDGWREAAYSLAEALPPSWEELQPPAEQLRKFKEMVALQNEKTQKLLDNADKHSKMYP